MYQSTNLGDMVLLSNGPAQPQDGREFFIELRDSFSNVGSLSVVGTSLHRSQMKIQAIQLGKRPPVFVNKGVLYLKNAILHQTANFGAEGCVAIGENAVFVANAKYTFGNHRLHFLPGSATLQVTSVSRERVQKYTITNYPSGSSVQIKLGLAQMTVCGKVVTLSSFPGKIQLSFEFGSQDLDPEKFHFENNRLTYAGNLLRESPDLKCKSLQRVVEKASTYEIKV